MWLSQTSRTLRNGRSNCLYLATTATGCQEPEVPSFSASGWALFPASCECGCSNLLPQPWLGMRHCSFKEDSQLKTAFSILECKTGKVEAYSNTGRQKSCLSWNKTHGGLCANASLHLHPCSCTSQLFNQHIRANPSEVEQISDHEVNRK